MNKQEKTDGRVEKSLQGGGKTPLVSIRMPRDLWEKAQRRAGKGRLSQWIRGLIERALKR